MGILLDEACSQADEGLLPVQVAAAEAARAAAVERLQAAQLAAEQAGRRQDQDQQHMQVRPRRVPAFAEFVISSTAQAPVSGSTLIAASSMPHIDNCNSAAPCALTIPPA